MIETRMTERENEHEKKMTNKKNDRIRRIGK